MGVGANVSPIVGAGVGVGTGVCVGVGDLVGPGVVTGSGLGSVVRVGVVVAVATGVGVTTWSEGCVSVSLSVTQAPNTSSNAPRVNILLRPIGMPRMQLSLRL